MIYRSINYSGGLSSKPKRFLLLQQDGRITQYVWYENEGNDTHPNFQEKKVLQKENGKPFEPLDYGLGFSKKMSALVSDYPELAEKIAQKKKGYGILNIYEIISEYNKWYSQKNE